MTELRIPLDPCNPGQFYACCGLIELFDLIGANALSQFNIDRRHPREGQFVLASECNLDLGSLARAVREAKYEPLPRPGTEGAPPDKDSIAPARVSIFDHCLLLDWWLELFHQRPLPLKCWAGQVTTQKLLLTLPTLVSSDGLSFDKGALTTTRFGIDPRSAWVALNLGYSPNEQGQESRTYPVVEILGAFGLQGFRPAGNRTQGFTYHLWLSPLPRLVARTSCIKPWDGLATAAYRFSLGERGSYKYFGFAEPYTSA